MHANLSWDSLIESVLQEIGKFGLGPATINHYRQTFKRLKQYAAAQNVEHYCDGLIRSFLHAIVGLRRRCQRRLQQARSYVGG